MFSQLKFYLTHSLNDLNVNRRLTVFALLSIAVGVAAIVSLQTLSLMIADTLEENLQLTNRGDVRASIISQDQYEASLIEEEAFTETTSETEDNAAETASGLYDQLEEDGVLVPVEFAGAEISALAEGGINAIEAWIADSDYAGQVTLNYQIPLSDPLSAFLGNGAGASITVTETGAQASQVSSYVIDPATYPFYDDISGDLQNLCQCLPVCSHDFV
ncbi:MAG: hypothetical protein AAFV98_06575, partial [Chloroflexota bacterium]